MPSAGEMRDRFRFERRAVDDNGDRLGPWGDAAITVAAKLISLHGGEGVQQARLQGQQPVILTIRVSAAARMIDNGWRAVDAGDETRVFDITSAELTLDRAFVDILATRKVGQGGG